MIGHFHPAPQDINSRSFCRCRYQAARRCFSFERMILQIIGRSNHEFSPRNASRLDLDSSVQMGRILPFWNHSPALFQHRCNANGLRMCQNSSKFQLLQFQRIPNTINFEPLMYVQYIPLRAWLCSNQFTNLKFLNQLLRSPSLRKFTRCIQLSFVR